MNMRKKDLIKHLQALKGNPEILLWNGIVEDWMHVSPKLSESNLVRKTFEYLAECVRVERCIEQRNWDYQIPEEELKELQKKYTADTGNWSTNEYVKKKDIQEKRYKKKRVVFIEPKLRNELHTDRQGSIRY